MPRELIKHYFWVCLQGYFWKRLAFDSADWIMRSALINVVSIILKGTKRQRKGNFSLLELRCPFFSCSETLELLVLGPLDWMNYTTGFPGFPDCRWQIVEFLSLHKITLWANSYNKSISISIYLCLSKTILYWFSLLVVFLENPD